MRWNMTKPGISVKAVCKAKLKELQTHLDFMAISDALQLSHAIAQVRQRPVVVLAIPLPAYMDGAWFDMCLPEEGLDLDVILVAANASKTEQRHALLHEIAHMVLGHSSRRGRAELAYLLPFTDPEYIVSCLCRSRFDTRFEQEAETLATLLEIVLAGSPTPQADAMNDVSTAVHDIQVLYTQFAERLSDCAENGAE